MAFDQEEACQLKKKTDIFFSITIAITRVKLPRKLNGFIVQPNSIVKAQNVKIKKA